MINIDEDNLKSGVLGLVMAVVEILRDTLGNQAARRMESGSLSDEEIERLGRALADLDVALEDIKREQGLEQAVQSVRDGLDDVVNDLVQGMIDPRKWREEPSDAKRKELVGAGR
jgi:Ser/Thr protein kinase RdoA (MazF antagonist)